jgi:prepilin-type N-terminal cleavage/methylation domain-containing protein
VRQRAGFSLLELVVAAAALSVVIGPLVYIYTTGNQLVNSAHSAAMLSCLVATERLRADLDQLVYPDGPDEDDQGKRKTPILIKDPGPDEGCTISFWIPDRREFRTPMERRLKLVQVRYSLERIRGSDTFSLVRRVGNDSRPIPNVYLSQLWFKRLLFEVTPGGPASTTSPIGAAGNMPDDLMRVTMTAAATPADKVAMERRDAKRVPIYTTTFLHTLREPTLVGRMRERPGGERFQFMTAEGELQ